MAETFEIFILKNRDPGLEKLRVYWADEVDALLAVGPVSYVAPIEFTCDECRFKSLCPYSYDHYNTNGDCLASK